ncbi:MAG: hypothetical protein HXX20_19290 [Chloroflexi bacterium]|nr:hypothetical protein [Chloroflexota bacterium]
MRNYRVAAGIIASRYKRRNVQEEIARNTARKEELEAKVNQVLALNALIQQSHKASIFGVNGNGSSDSSSVVRVATSPNDAVANFVNMRGSISTSVVLPSVPVPVPKQAVIDTPVPEIVAPESEDVDNNSLSVEEPFAQSEFYLQMEAQLRDWKERKEVGLPVVTASVDTVSSSSLVEEPLALAELFLQMEAQLNDLEGLEEIELPVVTSRVSTVPASSLVETSFSVSDLIVGDGEGKVNNNLVTSDLVIGSSGAELEEAQALYLKEEDQGEEEVEVLQTSSSFIVELEPQIAVSAPSLAEEEEADLDLSFLDGIKLDENENEDEALDLGFLSEFA